MTSQFMDLTKQQKQTKEFFEKHSEEWYKNAKLNLNTTVNVVKIRNSYVENICSRFLNRGAKTLDVGCGVGDLVISLLQRGYDAFGIDFASSMIEKALYDAEKLNFSKDRFIIDSFFEFNPGIKFSLISANGFIEYISEEELTDFINRICGLLETGGIAIIESRNRLFNVFSFNNYTNAEIKIGQMNHLLEECVLFNNAKSMQELLNQNFASKISANLQEHDYTGNEFVDINVDKRLQYTPFQLIAKLRDHGFDIIDLTPYHIHAVTTGVKEMEPEIHTQLSYFLQNNENTRLRLFPQASSFMITVKKI